MPDERSTQPSDEPSHESRIEDALTRMARAWLARDRDQNIRLADWLAMHPEASAQLTEALLAAELDAEAAGAESVIDSAAVARNDQQFGPYRLLRELGRGGQAVVYEAIDTRLGRRVALKLLQRSVFASAAVVDRFRAEAATTSRLEHAGICPVFEIGEIDDCLFLAMRLVPGETLARRIERARRRAEEGLPYDLGLFRGEGDGVDPTSRGPRRWSGLLRYFESAAAALHAAHEAGVAHRDVKPGNLMVQKDGTAVVLDFGLAGDSDREGVSLTRSGDVFGTPAYMAPEQCRDAREADRRSDVFALGASLYEALTGRRAFQGGTPDAIVKKILAGRVPNPCRAVRGLPHEFALVVGKAMDPDPERRYQTAAAFAEDLERIRERRPVLAVSPSLGLRARRWVQRNPVVTGFLLIVLVAGGVALRGVMQASAAEERAAHLADAQQLDSLLREFGTMLPITDAARAESWLAAARALLARLPEHRLRLAELRARALPRSAADIERDRRAHPDHDRLRCLRRIEESLQLGRGTPAALAVEAAARRDRLAEIERLAAAVAEQRTHEFASEEDQVLHDALARLVEGLVAFGGRDDLPGIVMRALARRREERPVSTWDDMLASLAAMPQYAGAELAAPLPGLAPLRRDPQSGFWELYLVASGDEPRVDEAGALVIGERTALVFVLLPGGRFTLGASRDPAHPRYDPSLRPVEDSLVDLELDAFLISKYELTQAQWMRLSDGPNPSLFAPGANGWCDRVTLCNPVESVSWDEAIQVLGRHRMTLPTEAQWEYAARGDEDAVFWTVDAAALRGAENLRDRTAEAANLLEGDEPPMPWSDGFIVHAPVGSFRANPFGLHDVLGNVSEWCIDRGPGGPALFEEHLLARGTGEVLVLAGNDRAYRGGAFGRNDAWAHVCKRGVANGRDQYFGLRPVILIDR